MRDQLGGWTNPMGKNLLNYHVKKIQKSLFRVFHILKFRSFLSVQTLTGIERACFFEGEILIRGTKSLFLFSTIYAMGCLPGENRGNYRLRLYPPNLIRIMPAKGWRKGVTCLIGYLLTI